MSWDTTLLTTLRVLVNDLGSPPEHSDDNLKQIIIVGAQFVLQELEFSRDYTVTIDPQSISPDPTIEPKDTAFSSFILLKSACLVDQCTMRSKALMAGIRAKCGPIELDTRNVITGMRLLIEEGPCSAYENLKFEYLVNNTNPEAVLSPFVGNNFDPQNLNRFDGDRERNLS